MFVWSDVQALWRSCISTWRFVQYSPTILLWGSWHKKEMYSASDLVCHTNFIVSHSVQSVAKLNGCFQLICLLVWPGIGALWLSCRSSYFVMGNFTQRRNEWCKCSCLSHKINSESSFTECCKLKSFFRGNVCLFNLVFGLFSGLAYLRGGFGWKWAGLAVLFNKQLPNSSHNF